MSKKKGTLLFREDIMTSLTACFSPKCPKLDATIHFVISPLFLGLNRILTPMNFPARPRLYSLDALRGLAALGVVLWHWQHFFTKGMGLPYHAETLPFFGLLFPFYRFGWLAVFLFFSLSGFVFFWLYAQGLR